MESKVDVLESMFQKAESDLSFLSRKLDFEFEQNIEENKANPAKMLQKITEIKKEFSSIVKEASAIQEAQKEAVSYFQTQLMTACQLLQKVQQEGSLEGNEKPEELEKLEEILGVQFPHHSADPCYESTEPNSAANSSPSSLNQNNKTFTLEEEPKKEVEQTSEAVLISPYERRAQCKEFLEVTQEEFESVSSLIRGRVKLTDVNMAYRILWRHFKEEDNSDALSPSEMYKMGLKVSGATGEAKLKVLRGLKLCSLSNKMDVKLL